MHCKKKTQNRKPCTQRRLLFFSFISTESFWLIVWRRLLLRVWCCACALASSKGNTKLSPFLSLLFFSLFLSFFSKTFFFWVLFPVHNLIPRSGKNLSEKIILYCRFLLVVVGQIWSTTRSYIIWRYYIQLLFYLFCTK